MASLADLLLPLYQKHNANIQNLLAGMPNYGYGQRYQEPNVTNPSQPKSNGYMGVIQNPNDWQEYSTEIGVGNENGEHPAMVPTLSHRDLVNLLYADHFGGKIPTDIYNKAENFRSMRQLLGKSPWAGINDKQSFVPLPIPETSLTNFLGR